MGTDVRIGFHHCAVMDLCTKINKYIKNEQCSETQMRLCLCISAWLNHY